MATGVNVKMGVSGVTQFKQSMNQAKQSVKTLDAQLSLSEKQFKATGDSQSYMTEKAELLKAKLEAQKSVLENAEKALESMSQNGVERSSKAYQDMYRQMLAAKGEILDTENAMQGMADTTDGASDNVSEMNSQLKNIGKGISFQNVTTGLKDITNGLENAAKKAINLGRKIFDAMMGAGSYADDLSQRAQVYGLSTEELQRMDKTAELIDTSVEAIISSQKKLKKGLGSADKGVMGAFAELLGEGYDPKARGWENAFWDAGEALMKFADEEEKEVYAQRLFGKSWSELIPLFEAGRKEYEEMNASWTVLSDEQIENLGKMDDEYKKLQENIKELKLEILSNFAEPMASLMTTINEKVQEFSDWLKSDEGKAVVDSVVGKVKEAIEWISKPENIQTAIDALKTIAAGWALIKLTGGAADMLKLVNGAKNLFGGGGDGTTSVKSTGQAAPGPAKTTGSTGGNGPGLLSNINWTAAGAVGSKALGAVGTAGYLAMGAMLVDAWVREGQWMQEAYKRGEEQLKRTEEMSEQFKSSDWFGLWDTLNSYLGLGGKGTNADTDKMDAFAERYIAWLKDEVEDPLLDQLNEQMSLEDFEKLNEAIRLYTSGAQFYNEEDLAEMTEPLQNMLRLVEQEMEKDKSVEDAGKKMKEAADELKEMPGEVKKAVTDAMEKMSVNIDGRRAGQILGPYISETLGNFVLNNP